MVKWNILMKFKILSLFTLIVILNTTTVQSNVIFRSGFEYISKPNDTGINWAGEYPSGNSLDCTSASLTSPQDCNSGRDAMQNASTDGHAGFSFTKLDVDGIPLADQSVSYGVTPWACVKDNNTGLVWEVKTDAGIHNKHATYQWGGLTAIGRDHPNALGPYFDDWNILVQGSNTEILCGFDNWRVPTVDELSGLANLGTFNPAIDINYFPKTEPLGYWSSSPITGDGGSAWTVFFGNGNNDDFGRNFVYRVRLVRGLEQ